MSRMDRPSTIRDLNKIPGGIGRRSVLHPVRFTQRLVTVFIVSSETQQTHAKRPDQVQHVKGTYM